MKVRVKNYLNVRTGSPEILVDNNPGYFNPNDVIEVAETVIGEKYKDSDIWYKLTDGSFVWAGGADQDTALLFAESTPVDVSKDLSKKLILNITPQKRGRGITIGVLDTGIDTGHPSLKQVVISEDNFLPPPQDATIRNAHGTMVAGTLTANDEVITGTSIDAKIRSYRVNDDGGNTINGSLRNALDHIANGSFEIDILNLSLDIIFQQKNVVQSLIDKLIAKGILVVVAGYNANRDKVSNIGSLNNVISIGIFKDNADFLNMKQTGLPPEYHIAFLNEGIQTTGLFTGPKHRDFRSSSAYTAITTGIIANFLSDNHIPKPNRLKEVRTFLESTSFTIQNEPQALPFKPYKK